MRLKIPVTITLSEDQVAYIDEQNGGQRERSRWIRNAIDREIARLRQFKHAINAAANASKSGKNISK